jgi:hypothetical protein
MDAGENHNGQAPKPKPVAVAAAAPTFMLKRFAWGAPDRLEVSGTFGGLHDAPADASPVLIVSTGERIHRLPAVPNSLVGSPKEGRLWRAAFAWQDAPVAFEVAQLQIGADVVVRLPEPGATHRLSRPRALEVRTGGNGDDLLETGEAASDERGKRASIKSNRNGPRRLAGSPRKDRGAGDGAERVGSKVDLLAAQEQVLEVGAALQQTQEELTRARDDLSAERERHAEDRERFREGLAKVQGSTEEALAVEQSATQQLGADLREGQDALDAKDTTLEDLRGKLEESVTAQTQQESKAQAEIDALRERVATLERAGAEADQLRSELEQSRTQADNAQAGLEAARSAVGEARTDAERLLGRLTALAK